MPVELNRSSIIRRRLLLYAIVIVLSIAFVQPSHLATQTELSNFNKPEQLQEQSEVPRLVSTETSAVVAASELQSQANATVTETQNPASAGTCEEAIIAVWPANLQAGARIVAQKESGMRSDAVGAVNYDGSQDYGCFQINNFAHPAFFAGGNWSDPTYNAQYALAIYNGRGNWTAWYAVRGILW